MQYVAKRACFTLPEGVADKIIDDSGGNMRKAILVLEALKMQSSVSLFVEYPLLIANFFSPDLTGAIAIAKPDWETYCNKVGDMIIAEQTPSRVMEVRQKLYELLSHCIPPTIILKVRSLVSIVKIILTSIGADHRRSRGE